MLVFLNMELQPASVPQQKRKKARTKCPGVHTEELGVWGNVLSLHSLMPVLSSSLPGVVPLLLHCPWVLSCSSSEHCFALDFLSMVSESSVSMATTYFCTALVGDILWLLLLPWTSQNSLASDLVYFLKGLKGLMIKYSRPMNQRKNQKQKMNMAGGGGWEWGRGVYNPRQRLASIKNWVFTLASACVASKLRDRPFQSALLQFGVLNTGVKNASLFWLTWLATLSPAFQMEWHGHWANLLTGMTLTRRASYPNASLGLESTMHHTQ